MAIHQHGCAQFLKQPVANVRRVRDLRKVGQGEDEFIAAMAGKHVDVSNRCLQPIAGSFETDIAQLVSQVVVDLFEAIQINATDCNQLALTPGGDGRLTQPILQQGSIGQPGQEVIVGTMDNLVIKLSMFDSHAPEIAEAADGFANGVVQQCLVRVEYGHHARRFSGTGSEG